MDFDEAKTLSFWRAVLAEYVATTFFLVAVSFAVLQTNVILIALAIGLAIATLAQCFGPISGGHINPAVTFGLFVARKISLIKCIAYIVSQCLGAITGSGISYGLAPPALRSGMGVTDVAAGISPAKGFCIELLFTALLVYTVFTVIDDKRQVEPYGATLAIGVSIVVAHLAAVPLTGSSINPARSFGPAVVMNKWNNHWVYWIGPLLGGALAGLAYQYVFFVDDVRRSVSADNAVEMASDKQMP